MRAKNTSKPKPDEPVVYFIQAHCGGPIKIGYSGRADGVSERLSTLQTGNSQRLVVRHVIPAPLGVETEREWHRRFARYRMQGEWFLDAPEVTAATRCWPPIARTFQETKRVVEQAYETGLLDGRTEVEERTRQDMREFFTLAGDWFSDDGSPEWPAMFQALRTMRRWNGLNITTGTPRQRAENLATQHVDHTSGMGKAA